MSAVISETAKEVTFRFVCACEECGAEGDLTLLKADAMQPFSCPEGCGAMYVPWRPNKVWQLRCVVMPHYAPAPASDMRGEGRGVKD
jgi:hypothetical protein